MKLFKSILRSFFSNLHSQVVTINRGGRSPSPFLLFILVYLLYIGRSMTVTACLYYNITAYFKVDVESGIVLYKPAFRSKHLTSFFMTLTKVFSLHLFWLLYVTPDSQVWSHLYDIVVRNRYQTDLQWWSSPAVNRKPVVNHWFSQLAFFRPRLKISKFFKLSYYSFLEENFRKKCILICLIFEILTTFTLFFLSTIALLHFYSTLAKLSLEFFQIIFLIVLFPILLLYAYITLTMNFLVILVIFLVCHIYSELYRRVNRNLAKTKLKLNKKTHLLYWTLIQFNRAGISFRADHCRLTVFILHFSSSTVSKIIACFLVYIIPCHSYYLMLAYFKLDNIPRNIVQTLFLVIIVWWLFLMVITINVAKVNKKICSSGQTLSAIFARKGVFVAKQKQYSWVNNLGSIWRREVLKLSTYYELIWRTDKKLAFTAGQMDIPMDWKFVLDVSYCTKTSVLK